MVLNMILRINARSKHPQAPAPEQDDDDIHGIHALFDDSINVTQSEIGTNNSELRELTFSAVEVPKPTSTVANAMITMESENFAEIITEKGYKDEGEGFMLSVSQVEENVANE